MRETEYHKIIPERVEILQKIQDLLSSKSTVHFTTSYADRELPFLSHVINPDGKDTIMITAGCHGNEPAPIYALYDLLKQGIDTQKRVIIVPCIVPHGFCLHDSNNVNGININRDFFSENPQKETLALMNLVKEFKPRFVLNMHEDPDEEKFYLYLGGQSHKEVAGKLIKASSLDIDYYKDKQIHNDKVVDGIIEFPERSTSFVDYLIDFLNL